MILVLDASAAVRAVLKAPESEKILDMAANARIVTAPDLFIAEITNAIWKHWKFDNLPLQDCYDSIERASQLVTELAPTSEMNIEALDVARQTGTTVYDAMYLVTARRLAASLLTLDKKLAAAAKSMSIITPADVWTMESHPTMARKTKRRGDVKP